MDGNLLLNEKCPQCGTEGRIVNCVFGDSDPCESKESSCTNYCKRCETKPATCQNDCFDVFHPHQHCLLCGCTIIVDTNHSATGKDDEPVSTPISFQKGYGVYYMVNGDDIESFHVKCQPMNGKDAQILRIFLPHFPDLVKRYYLTSWNEKENRVDIIFGSGSFRSTMDLIRMITSPL